jgi:hypothetical protein
MIPRRYARRKLADAKNRAVFQRRGDLPQPLIGFASVVYGERLRSPDHTGRLSRPARGDVLGDFVDRDDRAPVCIMSGDYPSYLNCHCFYLLDPSDHEYYEALRE